MPGGQVHKKGRPGRSFWKGEGVESKSTEAGFINRAAAGERLIIVSEPAHCVGPDVPVWAASGARCVVQSQCQHRHSERGCMVGESAALLQPRNADKSGGNDNILGLLGQLGWDARGYQVRTTPFHVLIPTCADWLRPLQ